MATLKTIFISTLALLCGACTNGVDDPVGAIRPGESTPFYLEVTEITATSAQVSVIPKDKTAKYHFDVLTADYFDLFNDQYGFQRFVDSCIKNLMEIKAMTREEVLELMLLTGDNSHIFSDLSTDSNYHAVVIGTDDSGTISTDVITLPFKTLAE